MLWSGNDNGMDERWDVQKAFKKVLELPTDICFYLLAAVISIGTQKPHSTGTGQEVEVRF
jgi:hypothetical protein